MTNTQLGLFRHGQTDWNINFLLQGITDIPMNQTGVAQIIQARQALVLQEWDVLLTSPLGRARHSAELVAEVLGLEIAIEELLLERSFGDAEGLSYEQWRKRFDSMEEIPGVEPSHQVESRAADLLEKIRHEYPGQRVLAVSHGAFIRSVIAIASDNELPRDGERLSNASLNELAHSESGWSIKRYSLDSLKLADGIE